MNKDELIEELKKENERLHKENKDLDKKVKDLEAQLSFFNNPHTPSSKQFFKVRIPQSSKKIGAPLGHEGSTRKFLKPDIFVEHFLKNCPQCDSILGAPFDIEERLVEEIPEPQPITVTKHSIGFYNCKNCGVIVAETDIPKEGCFGKNILAHTTLMKYDDRLPARKVVNTLNRSHSLQLTHSTVLSIIQRVVKTVQHVYEQLKVQVRNVFNVFIDETGIKVQGKNFWTWIFTTATMTVFVIRKSRHCNVVKEILGENFKGVINCDGWETYKTYKEKNKNVLLQRCWAHALREVEAVAQKYDETKPLYEWFRNIYEKVCESREQTIASSQRERIKENCELELRQWLETAKTYRAMKTVRTKIENGFEHWFTCIIYPEVEPTNNRAERNLREEVVLRKITGTLRNEKGTRANEVIMSLLTTWKQQNKNPYTELKTLL